MSHAPRASCCPHCNQPVRLCGKCDRLLPIGEFYACSTRPDGLQWACKTCQAAYKRERRERLARRREAARRWRAEHPGRHAEISRRYRAKRHLTAVA